jgi:hypothetical protein
MKILYLQNGMHHKNQHAITHYKNIQLHTIHSPCDLDSIDLTQFDCVYSPATPINASKHPTTKFIFGPHFSVFPIENQINIIKSSNSTYIQPSEWVSQLWRDNVLCKNMRIQTMPFAVDVNKFCETMSTKEKTTIFVYYKRRHPNELSLVTNTLKNANMNFVFFNYGNYSESEYLNVLQKSKFGIILDAHESQGFAIEEALSCNVPLLVWNVTSMNQEFNSSYSNISATTIPYWDERCGEFFHKSEEFIETFNMFLSKLDSYKPREFILETLTKEICEKKLMEIIS